jgi:hypothetical protein
VRIAVPTRDGRSLFVGGVSFADDPESAILAAEADAQSQVHLAAVERSNTLFDRGAVRSGIETTALERLELKNSLANEFAKRMVATARQDSVYYKLCGDSPSDATRSSGAVCQAFVLVSVDDREWDSLLAETLARETARRREEGQSTLAELSEWLSRQLAAEIPETEREQRR